MSKMGMGFKAGTASNICEGMLRKHLVDNLDSNVEVRDRYHSPFKDELEIKYSESDMIEYDKMERFKTSIQMSATECKKSASRWREFRND